MNVQLIRERRASTIAAMRSLTETASREDRDLTEAESRGFDEQRAMLAKLDKDLERAQFVMDAERSLQAAEPRRGTDGSFDQLAARFQVTRAIQAQIDTRSTDCGLELEVSAELARQSGRSPRGVLVPYSVGAEKRDVLVSNTGSYTYPNPLRADLFIEPLRINPVVAQAGAMTLSGLVGNQHIPRQITSSTISSVKEHRAVSETEPTFDEIILAPKTIGAYTEVSRRWLINSTPSGEQIVRNDLTKCLNIEVDKQALTGDPTSTSPTNAKATGVRNVSGINTTAFSSAPTWAKIQAMIGLVAADNAEQGSLAFVANSYVRAELLKTLMASSTDSRHLTEDPRSLAGFPLLMSNHLRGNPTSSPMVAGELFYANWNDLILGFWSGIDLVTNPYHTDVFSRGGALISAFLDFDVQVRHADSFCVGTSITLTP